ncbi:hypothetical protein HPO96_15500 [Kribbella sandramycini]|uniref:Secreted protein n=1 Tax=Kribbella sandramycini TaxID=60450 RepID=A0A7Y4L182_9ACTN|nr:hypothetical protein [Kribbella sandramycini]MBB6565383.1 hypothetical protein [Kribbella sandramycini]NOL41652.1 hypothetical protein [Kribbella sandramycini]
MSQLSRRSVLGIAAAAAAAPFAITLPARAATFYPVDAWTYTARTWARESYWGRTQGEALVGRPWGDSGLWRSFFRVPIAALAGQTITSAKFTIQLLHTPTGAATPVQLFLVRDLDPKDPLTWENSSDGATWRRWLGDAKGSAWNGQPKPVLQFIDGPVHESIQDALLNGKSHISFALRAADENDQTQWKKFAGASAGLEITTA